MAHKYLRPIPVVVKDGLPTSFRWHGADYEVAEVLATRHLMDRWWASVAEADFRKAKVDRPKHRVRCRDEQIFDLFHGA